MHPSKINIDKDCKDCKDNKDHKYKKKKIPKAIRQQVWIKCNGKKFENKCYIMWCKNVISVFNYHVGHDVPESKGGGMNIENLFPICSNCNLSMSSTYSISEWNNISNINTSMFNRIYRYIYNILSWR